MVVVMPFFVALAAMVSVALYPERVAHLASALTRPLPPGVRTRVDGLLERFFEGFQALRSPRRLAAIFVLSLPVWLLEGTMYYLIALGFGLSDHFETVALMAAAMLLVMAVSNLATSLPSSQGSVGPFEFFAVLALVYLGVASGLATAYAVVLHLALLLPVVVVGLGFLALDHLSLGQLTRREPMAPVPAATVPEKTS